MIQMKRFLLLKAVALAVAAGSTLGASAQSTGVTYLNPGTMVFPSSTLVTSKLGQVDIKWDKDIVPMKATINVTVNTPNQENVTMEAEYIPVTITDTGENFGYPFPVLEVDLGKLIEGTDYNPYYGKWEISIPAGVVGTDNAREVNPAQTITLTWYQSNDSFSVTPAFGSSEDVPSYNSAVLKDVKIVWNGTTALRRNPDVKGALLQENGYTSREFNVDDRISVSGNALVLDFSDLAAGKYRLLIPAGYVFLTSSSGTTQTNSEISARNNWFGVTQGMSSGIVLPPFASRGNGYPSVDSSLEYVEVEFPGQTLTLTGNGGVRLYPDEFMDFPPVSIPASNISIVDDDVLRINYVENVKLNEQFYYSNFRNIVIPEGLVRNASGEPNPLQKIMFTVINAIDVEPTWTPADGSVLNPETELITLSWAGAKWVDYPENSAYLKGEKISDIRLRKTDANLEIEGEISIGGTANSTVTFDFSELKLPGGTYTIVMPLGAFAMETDTGNPVSQAMTYTFVVEGDDEDDDEGTTTAVQAPGEDGDGWYRVYSIGGMFLKTTDKVSELQELAPGIYIINGRKVAIEK